MIIFNKNHIVRAAKKIGFHKCGNFLVGFRNNDVISGFSIDAPPSGLFVWTFILPAFDDISFLHMSLGERVIDASLTEYPIQSALENAWSPISKIRRADQIMNYLKINEVDGEYAKWSLFLCLIRIGKFAEAEAMTSDVEKLRAAGIPRKLEEIRRTQINGEGWPAVQGLLVEWSIRTGNLLDSLPTIIDVTD